jgi:hypothetical protein
MKTAVSCSIEIEKIDSDTPQPLIALFQDISLGTHGLA